MTKVKPRRRTGSNYTASTNEQYRFYRRSAQGQSGEILRGTPLGAVVCGHSSRVGSAVAVTQILERRSKRQFLDRKPLSDSRLKRMNAGRQHRKEYPTVIGTIIHANRHGRMVGQLGESILRTTVLIEPKPAIAPVAVLENFNRVVDAIESETTRTQQLERQFSELTAAWRAETAFMSSLTQMCTHPAYQRIVGMGESALPFIFRDLQTEPDHWFWALKAITGCDPVPPSHRGDLDAMASDWLTWGRSNGYIAP